MAVGNLRIGSQQTGGRRRGMISVPGAGRSGVAFQGEDAIADPLSLEVLRSDDLPAEKMDPQVEATRKILTLLKSPNKEAQAKGLELAQDGLDPKTLKSLGLDQQAEKEKGLLDRAKGVVGTVAEKSGALKALELLGRPQQAALELLQEVSYDTGLSKHYAPEGTTKLTTPDNATPEVRKILGDTAGSGGYRDVWRAIKGEERYDPASGQMTKDLRFSNALGYDQANFNDKGALGWVGKGADFVGGAAVDPLNFVGGGTAASSGKVAARGAEMFADDAARELTPALAKQLAKTGQGRTVEELTQAIQRVGIRKALSKADLDEITRSLTRDALEGSARSSTGRITGDVATAGLREDGLIRKGVRGLTGKGRRSGAERVAEDAVTSALRYDRGGLRIGGRSVVPEGVRSPVRSALKGDRIQIGSRAAEAAVLDDAAKIAQKQENKAQKALAKSADLRQQADDLTAAGNDTKAAAALTKSKQQATAAATALAKAEELRNTTDVQALLDLNPSLGNVLEPVVQEVPRKILPNVNPVAGAMGKVREAFQPRAGIRASTSLAPGIDAGVYEASIKAGGLTTQAAREGERLLNVAYKNSDAITPELVDETRRALDIGGSTTELLARVTPEQRQYVQTMIDLRDKTYDTIVNNSLANPAKLRSKEDYLGRYVTPEGRKLLEEATKLNPMDADLNAFSSSAKQAVGQGGRLKARQILPNSPISDVENFYREKLSKLGLNVPEGVNILEHDPGKILANRFNETMPALQFRNTVKNMESSLKDTLGQDLVKVVDPGQKATKEFTKRGLQKVDLGEAGAVYAHPDLVPEITEFKRLTIEPDAVSSFGKTMDGWNRLWKSYATVPVITGSGFHVKNSIGNGFNNYLAGVKSYAYKDAIELQKDIWQAKRKFPELTVPEAMAANGVSADKIAKAELALENQVLEEGFFNTDLTGKAEHAIKGKKSRGQRVLSKVDVRNPETMFGVPTGRKIGEHVEDNARLAHFISKLDETGDAAAAAASVRKYLFDYGDLTPFERKVGKRVHAFYTFTRKNTPLQFAEIARNPAAFNRLALAESTALGTGAEGEDVPSFMDEIGQPVGRGTAGLLSGNKNQVVANIETPFDSAAKTVDPLLLLSGDRTAADASQSILGNWSGGPAQAGRLLMEEATGKSLFSGSDLRDPEGRRKVNPLLRASDLFIPSASKAARTAGLSAAGAQTDSQRMRIIRALTGVQAKEVTPEMQKIAQNERLRDIKDIIEALKKKNVDVPTVAELQSLGVLKRTVRKKRKAS